MKIEQLHILVTGVVQGVGFRASSVRAAQQMGVNGWSRNTPDGDVEIVAEGASEPLQRFLDWCHRGPTMARVETVEILARKPLLNHQFEDFQIRY